MSTPDEFLASGPAPVGINTTGAWAEIRANEQLDLMSADALAKLTDGLPDKTDNNVGIIDKQLNLTFSSERNAKYFAVPGVDSLNNTRENNAWTGDDLGSGIMLLDAGQSESLVNFTSDVCAAFGIDLTASSNPLTDFIKAIDKTGPLQVKLSDAPDWNRDGQGKLDPSFTLQWDMSSKKPTSATWCVSAQDGYSVVTAVDYDLQDVTTALTNVANYFASAFSGFTFKSASMPTVTLTLTRRSVFTVGAVTPPPIDASAVVRTTTLSFGFQILGFNLYVDVAPTDKKLVITPMQGASIPPTQGDSIRDKFEGTFGTPQDMVTSMLPQDGNTEDPFRAIFDLFHLWYIEITDDSAAEAGKKIQWGVGIMSIWKIASNPLCVALTYDSRTSAFAGKLLFEKDFPGPSDLRAMTWDPRLSPTDILAKDNYTPSSLGNNVSLFPLFGMDIKTQPPIPHILTSAEVSLSRVENDPKKSKSKYSSVFTFAAEVVRDGSEPTPDSGGAPTGFSWIAASINATITSPQKNQGSQDSPGPKTYLLDLFNTFTLAPSDPSSTIPTADFAASLHCDKDDNVTTWVMSGSAHNLSVGLIHSFFEPGDASTGAMAVLDKLTLQSMDVIYTYEGTTASSFIVTGILLLGALELDMSYQYVSTLVKAGETTATAKFLEENPTDGAKKLPKNPSDVYDKGNGTTTQVKFVASLRLGSPGSTIADIAESIKPGAADALPEFVGGIVVNPTVAATGDAPVVELEFDTRSSTDPDDDGNFSVLTLWLNIAGFNLTFIQFRTAKKKGQTSGSGNLKRILRISVDQIPMMDKIPLVGNLPQPFDHLEYLWVEDETPATDQSLLGITKEDLDQIMSKYPADIPPIQTQDSKTPPKDSSNPNKPNIVLQAGHHFMVVVKGKVVLDHVFHNADKKSTQPSTPTPMPKELAFHDTEASTVVSAAVATPIKRIDHGGIMALEEDNDQKAAEPSPTKGNTSQQAGPLSISALTFQFKNPSLVISVDATLALGPLNFSVIGFTLSIDLTQVKLDDLSAIVTKGLIQPSLHGIEVGVNQAPLTLEGVFIHDEVGDVETYSGGIAVGFEAWQVLAIGQYMIKSASATSDGFRAVFVYGKLDGPLVELELVTISGVRLGFGYNYAVTMPDVNHLYQFPFISDSASAGCGNDPMKVLDALVYDAPQFVYPKEGSAWFCAGMTITAFDLLTLTAVMVFDVDTGKAGGEGGVTAALLGDGIFQMEPLAPVNASLFYVEILVSVEIDFTDGYIAANAVMAPPSHVYVPQARLVGGAAFYLWFGPNTHAGDWVVSIGGYARGYDVPSHYPNPDRVGLNFTVGDMIQVSGLGYLAVTPKCAMAGGQLHFSLSVGPVSAYCDVVFDAFINFKPFHFRAEISLSVGVECDIDILFIHIHISIHLGADMTIWGPNDFGGHAWVDFWFFGFGIDFGASENQSAYDAVSLSKFYEMVKTTGPNSAPPANDTIGSDTDVAQHKFTVEQGLLPATTPPAGPSNTFPSTGATSQWYVQAGTLQFRIDCDFSLSEAYIRTDDRKDASTFPRIQLPAGRDGKIPDVPAVFSWPMHSKKSNPITSSVEIFIYQILPDPEDTTKTIHQPATGFHAQLVTKSAAVALWSVYDPNNDPLQPGRARPGNLTNGANGTVDLVQAVRLTPPDPVLRASPVVEFDATAAMRQPIDGIYTLPAEEDQGGVFAGACFEPDASDTTDAQVQRWNDFESLWNPAAVPPSPAPSSPGVAATSAPTTTDTDVNILRAGVVKSIADVLEWTIRPPEQMSGNGSVTASGSTSGTAGGVLPPSQAAVPNTPRINKDNRTDWQLLDAQPVLLVKELDRYYPALPYVSTVA